MTIGQSFRTFVAALPGMPESIYPSFLPAQHQGFPALTYSVSADAPQRVLDGISSAHSAMIDIDCWAKTIDEAEALAGIVNDALTDYFGDFNGLEVSDCWPAREAFWLYEDVQGLHRVSLQFALLYG
jgi:hypothetical protein